MIALRDTTIDKAMKSRLEVFAREVIVDIVVTAAIVWGLVLLGEPLRHVLTSALFIGLSGAGLVHLTVKTHRHEHAKQ